MCLGVWVGAECRSGDRVLFGWVGSRFRWVREYCIQHPRHVITSVTTTATTTTTRVVDVYTHSKNTRSDYLYSKTSLNRPLTVVNSCGPFREVVGLYNFPQHRKDTVNMGK